MKVLVTGASGFIGSHLCERLLAEGYEVVGVDRSVKAANLQSFHQHDKFAFRQLDLTSEPIDHIVAQCFLIFHQAAMAGLENSWTDLDTYLSCNVLATQRLLDACRRYPVERFIFGSTSSVYGRYAAGDESLPCRPISPYGLSKLAAENLCRAYGERGVKSVILRYFSVYGPRQRPDMAYLKFMRAIRDGEHIVIRGDGGQVRTNTYVDDIVEANIAALTSPPGETYNVAGDEAVTMNQVLGWLTDMIGNEALVDYRAALDGDQRVTIGDNAKMKKLGWSPATDIKSGLAKQLAWLAAA